ncbi:MAG: TonB-dependent receptor [Ignavibacteriales bacterium]|nr:TonB-dependent receptor [Ignavibacteriales bacterium]
MKYTMLYVCLAVFLCISSVIGGTTGKLAGRVTNKATGEALPSVNILIEGTSMGTVTTVEGTFVLVNILPGTYKVKASFIGYASIRMENVKVNIDQTTSISFALSETMLQTQDQIVYAERPMIQKDATGSVTVLSHDELQALPVANFTGVLQMQSGVVGEGSNLHIRGGRGNEVAYMIDGVYVQDPLYGGLGTQLHNDAIDQMEFLSGTFSAEYGAAMSGVVNLVTREGGEKFKVKLEGRTSEFLAQPFSDFHENRAVATVSGPILQDPRLSFFVSGERDARGSWLPFGYNNDISTLGKLSMVPLSGVKVVGSYRYASNKHQNYSHAYKYIPWMYYQPSSSSQQWMAQGTHYISSSMYYDVRVSYLTQASRTGILGADGEYLDTSQYLNSQRYQYLANKGTGNDFYALAIPEEWDHSESSTLNFKSDLVWQYASSHEIKLGAELKQHTLKRQNVLGPKRVAPYRDDFSRTPYEAVAYVQDKMEFPALILNLGLRFDYADQNASFRLNPFNSSVYIQPTSKVQLSPRIGIAHPVTDKTNISFSYGHFFQNPDYQYIFRYMNYDFKVREPIFGTPDLDAQRTVAYQVSLSHQFTDNLAGTFTLYYKDITGLVGTHYTGAYTSGNPVGYTVYVNEDYANTKGFEIGFIRRRMNNVSGSFTYSYQVAKGSASSTEEQYPGTQESTNLYYLSFDRTHSLNAGLSLTFNSNEGPTVLGIKLFENSYWNFISRASSGVPYTPTGRDLGPVELNSARYPWSFTLDAEIGRDWNIYGMRLTAFLECLNLTNYKNVVSLYTDSGSPDMPLVKLYSEEYYRNPANYGSPRRIRLGLRLSM